MSRQDFPPFPGAFIDSLEFAREGRRIGGSVPLPLLTRLADVLVSADGALECEIEGRRDDDGVGWLHLAVRGTLELRCQRCLEPVLLPLRIDTRLRLVPPGAPWPEDDLEDEAADAIPSQEALALLPLIEDEVLLAVPFAPRHGACEPPVRKNDERAASPFAVLAQLKKH